MSESVKKIWDYLQFKTGNAYGTAAIMGNLMAESSLNPECATGKNKTPNYAKDADTGAIDFEHDGVAFGLAQWCYHTRKKGLLDLAKMRGVSVGCMDVQIEYLLNEMSEKYKSVWKVVQSTNSIREASDIVMLKYEKPATTTEAAKQKRAEYGQRYYDLYAKDPAPSGKKMVRATSQVNIRMTPDKKLAKVGELKKGQELEWIATENGWHKVAVWVSGDFSEVRS